MKKIAIIDLKLGNIFNICRALDFLTIPYQVVDKKEDLTLYKGIVMPGVGSFGDAISNLKETQLYSSLVEAINSEVPYFGICLGMQILFDKSSEFGSTQGLSLISGEVERISSNDKNLRVPHIGWNSLTPTKKDSFLGTPLKHVDTHNKVYFVHSYHAKLKDQSLCLANTNYYDIDFCSVIHQKNIFATQFHPERSGEFGLEIIKNWASDLKESL